MKNIILILLIIAFGYTSLYGIPNPENTPGKDIKSAIQGEWVRFSQVGPIGLTFKADGTVEADLGRDNSVDVTSDYTIEKNAIKFRDKDGVSCPGTGVYRIEVTEYYISFDLIADNCGGRLKSTMGFWVKLDWEDQLKSLSEKIKDSPDPELTLSRSRMYMAIGKSKEAKLDLDQYIRYNPGNARVYLNRAGVRFPVDMEGVIADCNKALSLDPDSKNAYFMRGLALSQLGKQEEACKDFYKAIELGFTILKEAEDRQCAEFWESY